MNQAQIAERNPYAADVQGSGAPPLCDGTHDTL